MDARILETYLANHWTRDKLTLYPGPTHPQAAVDRRPPRSSVRPGRRHSDTCTLRVGGQLIALVVNLFVRTQIRLRPHPLTEWRVSDGWLYYYHPSVVKLPFREFLVLDVGAGGSGFAQIGSQ